MANHPNGDSPICFFRLLRVVKTMKGAISMNNQIEDSLDNLIDKYNSSRDAAVAATKAAYEY